MLFRLALCLCLSVLALATHVLALQGTLGVPSTLTGAVDVFSYGPMEHNPTIKVVGAAGATLTVNGNFTAADVASLESLGVNGFPDGYSPSPADAGNSPNIVGVEISVSSLTNFSFVLSFPSFTGSQLTFYTNGRLGVMFFNTATGTYSLLPSSQVQLTLASELIVRSTLPGWYLLYVVSSTPVPSVLANAIQPRAFLLPDGGGLQSFAITSNNSNVLTVAYVQSAAGTLSVSASATAQLVPALPGNVIVGDVYTITYSNATTGGVSSQGGFQSMRLSLLVPAASAGMGDSMVQWYSRASGTQANTWVQRDSKVFQRSNAYNAALLSVEVDTPVGAADWSVQWTYPVPSSDTTGGASSSSSVLVAFKLAYSVDALPGGSVSAAKRLIAADVATALQQSSSVVVCESIAAGSVVATVQLMGADSPASQALASSLIAQVNNASSALYQQPTTKNAIAGSAAVTTNPGSDYKTSGAAGSSYSASALALPFLLFVLLQQLATGGRDSML